MSKQGKNENKSCIIKDFFNAVKRAYSKKNEGDSEFTDKTFALLSSLLFYSIGYIMLLIILIILVGTPIYYIKIFDWSNVLGGIFGIAFSCLILFFLFILATLMIGTAKEQEKTRGEKSIVVFSAIVSFVALIVAVIALFK